MGTSANDGGAGGAGGSGTGGNDGGARRRGPSDEGRGVARKLLQRFRGRAEEALAELADENRALRDDRRELRDKVKGFEGTDVVVLKADDAKAYNAYKALGTPDEVSTKLKELPALQQKVTESERRTSGADAGKALGWNAEATAAMVLDKNLEVSFVDETKDGKTVKVPHVKPAGDKDAKPVKLEEFVKEKASYLLPALQAGVQGGQGGAAGKGGTTGSSSAQGAGNTSSNAGGNRTQFVEQGGANAGTAPGANASQAAIPGRRPYQTPGQRAAASGNK